MRELWGNYWTFAHNGQLKNSGTLPLGKDLPVGTTDSERAFCWLLAKIRSHYAQPPEDVRAFAHFLRERCDELRELGIFNMLLCDGRYLYAYCSSTLHWITRRAPFGEAQLTDIELSVNFSGETTPNDVVSVIATQPLTDNETWQVMAAGELRVFDQGEGMQYCL